MSDEKRIYTVTVNGHETTMRLSDADAEAHRAAGTLVGEGELAKTASARNKARHAARDKGVAESRSGRGNASVSIAGGDR